jgi:hypothetical protein
MQGFHVVDGEAFIDGTPAKKLVERAREKGWVRGPCPDGTLTFQQATLRAAAVEPDDDEPPPLPATIMADDDGTAPPSSPPRFSTDEL